MPQNPSYEHRKTAIKRLTAEARLPQIATALGLRVISRVNPPRALCPFHNDEHPSLYLYPPSKGGRAQFHCYACGAHGDVFDLVKKQLGIDFRGALDWLAAHYGIQVPVVTSSKRRRELQPRLDGLDIAFDLYRTQSPEESLLLVNWSVERHLDLSVLQSAEVFAVLPPKLSRRFEDSEREQFDALDASGLLRREFPLTTHTSNFLPLELPARDFFSSPRIIFTLRDERGLLAGFAGRALGDDSPKYLFSPGFPRGSTLYRWDRVRNVQLSPEPDERADLIHVFVVEGLMDALRLESLGLNAVASLGSNLTTNQVQLLIDYAKELDRNDRQLAVHLLFDDDEAGHRGVVSATVKLMDAALANPGLLVDVVSPSGLTTADSSSRWHDPDEIFREAPNQVAALERLRTWCRSPMNLLLSAAIDVTPAELDAAWFRLPDSQRLRAFRDVERRLERRATWVALLDRVPVFESHLGTTTEPALWQEPLSAFLRASMSHISAPISPIGSAERDDDARLIRALQIAEASTQRREFPLDEGSWDRLLGAADAALAQLRDLLATDSGWGEADPMLPVEVPKKGGEFRFKVLPSPEILTVQQYVLDELLRDYPSCPRFQRLIPGVRFSMATGTRHVETTGHEKFLPKDGETVSFAYMLDMDVIEQRAAPRRTGMFRSYYQCWQDFIAHIDHRVAEFPPGEFHVARLDVRRFYDSLPRSAVNAVLLPSVRDALAELADSAADSAGALECAGLFRPEIVNRGERADALVDWLCDQSFDYLFEHPGSGDSQWGHTLPQGPDLSAYLANISLFPLDRALTEIVTQLDSAARGAGDKTSRGGVYARYVDDMVIIARTASDLARLRAAIEKELGLLGMELNPKTDPVPVMNEAEVREWLTDRRGAGLGVSGPFDGPPVNTPLALLEPLIDAGETDRGDSLLILYDPRLDDPDLDHEELADAISIVRTAKDLRHGEQVACARHLWRCVLKKDPNAAPDTAVAEMVNLWRQDQPSWPDAEERAGEGQEKRDPGRDNRMVSDLLALIDGIDRLLGSRPDRKPTLSEQNHESLSMERKRMAMLVHARLCECLIDTLLPVTARSRFLHLIELKVLQIHCAATYVCLPSSETANVPHQAGKSRAKARLLISLAEAQISPALLDRAGSRADVPSIGMLFHEAVARLRIADKQHSGRPRAANSPNAPDTSSEQLSLGESTTAAQPADPLMPIRDWVDDWSQKYPQSGPPFLMILRLWMPDDKMASASQLDCAEIALGTLVNLAPKIVVRLLEPRTSLRRFALDGFSDTGSRILPTPPGIDVPGLLGLRDDDRIVLRTDFSKGEAQFSPNLSWEIKEMDPPVKWEHSEASLDEYQYLLPGPGTVRELGTPRWLAKAFRSLAALAQSSGELSCPPTAVNLLGPAIGNENGTSKWGVVGFCIPKARLVSQAFLRHGTGGLALEPVLEQHDDLWRIGTALADWLDRAETSRSLSQRLSARAIVTEPQDDWATEAMLRFSLYRLRGSGLPTSPLRLATDSYLPITIERLLRRLERFPDEGGTIGIAHLLATVGEGRAIQARISSRLDADTVGGGTALLVEIVRSQFRTDEELAKRLRDTNQLPRWAPLRRPARAWFALAQRLELLLEVDPQRDYDPTIAVLAAGTRLLAVEANLRAQALELWSLVDSVNREKFSKMPPSLIAWELDGEALLHHQQTTSLEREIPEAKNKTEEATDSVEWRNVRYLFEQLYWATLEGQRVQWQVLAGVTPLGWLVVIGALSSALSGEWRGSLADPSLLGDEGSGDLKRLASKLALAGDGDDDLPWGGLRPIADAWTTLETKTAFDVLHRLDTAAGFEVGPVENSRFHLQGSRRGPTEVHISDGVRQLQGWAISWAKTKDENRGGTERVTPVPGEQNAVFRWSETWRGSRLVGIGVVQPAMTALAGAAFSGEDTASKRSDEPVALSTFDSPEAVPSGDSDPILDEALWLTSRTLETAEPTIEVPPAKRDPGGSDPSSDHELRRALKELQTMQEDSWHSRREKSEGHARVALLQWEVDNSFMHPAFELCDPKKIKFDHKNPGAWDHSRLEASCAEARRIAILTGALKACNRFEVDILLLPEYSTRPETVDWLHANLSSLAPKTSVWAGTYRLPPGMSKNSDRPDWSAVHELVLPDAPEKRLKRLKKYPAVAAGEIFLPGQLPLEPLFADCLRDVRSHTLELICSEVFLATCPANLLPLARAQRELLRMFRVGGIGKNMEALINESILEDIKRFAHLTGLGESLDLRRTILLVPAMTSRTADYTVLGQAAFLSSGLTTVFCNAVCGSYAHGQSCFIGHDCWQAERDHTGQPSVEPYHGERPGIFLLNKGQLRKEEQALLIADIDPFYAFEGKPRPQMLPKPLKLVAHLPIIEAWQTKSEAKSGWCRCQRSDHSFKAAKFASDLLTVLNVGITGHWPTTALDSDPGVLTNALQQLAALPSTFRERSETNSWWLQRRARAYLSGHLADPKPWPPPVAVDWLWIDPKPADIKNYPRIEAPRYADPDSFKADRRFD